MQIDGKFAIFMPVFTLPEKLGGKRAMFIQARADGLGSCAVHYLDIDGKAGVLHTDESFVVRLQGPEHRILLVEVKDVGGAGQLAGEAKGLVLGPDGRTIA